MLRKRIIEVVAKRPGIALLELRVALPNTPYTKVRAAVRELQDAGKLEIVGISRLRLRSDQSLTPGVDAPAANGSSIRPLPVERLMAGR